MNVKISKNNSNNKFLHQFPDTNSPKWEENNYMYIINKKQYLTYSF